MSVPMQSEHIHVRVTFPITKTGPYNAEVLPQTTVGVVLAAAMDHFKVHNDSQFSYVLTYGGVQQPDSVTLGSLANGAHDMVFALVKKLTQGSTTTLDLESERNLDNDEGVVAEFLDQRGGSLKRDDQLEGGGDRSIYWASFRPRTEPSEVFVARIKWFTYPYGPPSIKFAEAVRATIGVIRAWPNIPGYRARNFDICRPMSREGYTLHQEWTRGSTAWPVDGNPFLWVIETMQFHFDNEYQGRAK